MSGARRCRPWRAAVRSGWALRLGAPLAGGLFAYVVACSTASGDAAVLELVPPLPPPHPAAWRHEVAALRAWHGKATATLLSADGELGALLLRRIVPGTPLADGSEPVARARTARPLDALHQAPARRGAGPASAGRRGRRPPRREGCVVRQRRRVARAADRPRARIGATALGVVVRAGAAARRSDEQEPCSTPTARRAGRPSSPPVRPARAGAPTRWRFAGGSRRPMPATCSLADRQSSQAASTSAQRVTASRCTISQPWVLSTEAAMHAARPTRPWAYAVDASEP